MFAACFAALFFIITGCAQTSYLLHQGVGQIALEWNGRDINSVLRDDSVLPTTKAKIKRVQKAKKYFFNYFNLQPTPIYDEITFLESKAVTYLVIVSPLNQVKAKNFSFPFVGSFPYIGFFNKKHAKDFIKKQEALGMSTYIRPVYAYSTLDKLFFYDNILSSFFELSDKGLDKLVFHELVHTVLFIEDEVGFNESLADLIADELYIQYAEVSESSRKKERENQFISRQLNNLIVSYAEKLNTEYKTSDFSVEVILKNFLDNKFFPGIKIFCQKHNLSRCWPLKQSWSNARFAAFNTYSEKSDKLREIYIKRGESLKEFFYYIKKKEKEFNYHSKFITFLD